MTKTIWEQSSEILSHGLMRSYLFSHGMVAKGPQDDIRKEVRKFTEADLYVKSLRLLGALSTWR